MPFRMRWSCRAAEFIADSCLPLELPFLFIIKDIAEATMEKAGICRYFQKGNCKLKGNCPYLHKKEQRAPCKFFA